MIQHLQDFFGADIGNGVVQRRRGVKAHHARAENRDGRDDEGRTRVACRKRHQHAEAGNRKQRRHAVRHGVRDLFAHGVIRSSGTLFRHRRRVCFQKFHSEKSRAVHLGNGLLEVRMILNENGGADTR